MTSPNTTFTEMVATTLRSHPSELADNVSKPVFDAIRDGPK